MIPKHKGEGIDTNSDEKKKHEISLGNQDNIIMSWLGRERLHQLFYTTHSNT